MDWFQVLFHSQPFDPSSLWEQIELIIRLLLACLCGGFIGLERTHRLKDAGIRTHVIVALGSALMMMVSKYAFYDVVTADGGLRLQADVSRIASQIVTGIGFLGAGIIFTRRGSVRGLTTAAGVWATAGIGMAIGSGMYLLGFIATVTIVSCQFVLHKTLHQVEDVEMYIKLKNQPGAVDHLRRLLNENRLAIEELTMRERSDDEISLFLNVRISENTTTADISLLLANDEAVLSFSNHSEHHEEI